MRNKGKVNSWHLAAAMVLFMALMMCFPQHAQARTKAQMVDAICSNAGMDSLKQYYADYDGDGKKELFMIVWDREDTQEIWFASAKETKRVYAGDYECYYDTCKGIAKVSKKQKLFYMEMGCGGSGSWSVCYYVSKGHVYKAFKGPSSAYEGLRHTSGAYFTIAPGKFDAMKDEYGSMSGHTYKKYYLKWTGKKFVEYKGKAISTKTLKSYKGGSTVLKKISSCGYKVSKIYKRGNGIININVYRKSSGSTYYENVTLKLKNKKVTALFPNKSWGSNYVTKSSYGGIYSAKGLK